MYEQRLKKETSGMQETLHSEEIFLLLIAKPVFKFVKKEFEKNTQSDYGSFIVIRLLNDIAGTEK